MAGILDIYSPDDIMNDVFPRLSYAPMDNQGYAKAYDLARPYTEMASRYGYGENPSLKQGLGSDVRHTTGSALAKFAMQDYLKNNFGVPTDSFLSDKLSNLGIYGSTAFQEVQDAYKNVRNLTGYGVNFRDALDRGLVQPMEDVTANIRATNIPYGTPVQEIINYAVENSPSKYMQTAPQISSLNSFGPQNYETPQEKANNNFLKTLSNLVFTPAYGDIPTKEEREGLESFNTLVSDTVMAEPYNMVSDTVRAEPYNMASDTVRAEPQIAQTEPAARNNQADILQIINQMEEEKKNYYTQPEEEPDFIDKMLSSLQRGAQYAGGANIGMGIGTLIDPSLGFISALLGGKYLGGADTSMTPTDRYNLSTYGGYGNMGVQDKYGINTVSLFGDYNKYVQNWNQKYGNRVYNTPYMQAKQAEMARREREQNANIEKQFADIRQQSESSGGYNPSTGYTAETASGLSGTGGSHHGYSTDYSSPF